MKPEAQLDTLEPKHLGRDPRGTLTEVPNPDRFDPPSAGERAARETGRSLNRNLDEFSQKARQEVRTRADGYLRDVGAKLRELGENANRAADDLAEGQPEPVARGARFTSKQLARLADYVENRNSSEIASDVRSIIREHPAAFLGGLAVVGFAVGRFLKASEPDQDSYHHNL